MATGSREENADPAPRLAEVVRIEAVVEPEAPPASIVGPLPKAGSRAASHDQLPQRVILNFYTLRWAAYALVYGPLCFRQDASCILMTRTRRHDPLNHAS